MVYFDFLYWGLEWKPQIIPTHTSDNNAVRPDAKDGPLPALKPMSRHFLSPPPRAII